MCERRPGPRCNDKCKVRDAKYKKFVEVSKKCGKETASYQLAAAELYAAQEVYDTTPKGLEELENKLTENADVSTSARYAKGKLTRDMQYDALEEINNGRVEKIAYLFSKFDPYFDEEEIASIIESSRENREAFVLQGIQKKVKEENITNLDALKQVVAEQTELDEASYNDFVKRLEEHAKIRRLDDETVFQYLEELKEMESPSKVNLYGYRSIGNALQKSKEQIGIEVSKIAALQDTTPEVAAEYFDSYRKQYKEHYSHLAPDMQPNPPKDWVEGTHKNSGIYNNPQSSFIPRDPATLYACYKLRTDLEAIPDFLKTSTKITAIDSVNGKYVATQVSRSGKLISKKEVADESAISRVIQDNLTDSVILMHKVPEKIIFESKQKHKFISLADMAERHLDAFDTSPAIMSDTLKSSQDALSLYSAIRKKMLKTWATKAARTNTERLSFSPTGSSRTIKLVR